MIDQKTNSIVSELHDEIYGLRCGIAMLKQENAKMQDENARLRSCLSDDADNARQIMAENAKLQDQLQLHEDICTADETETWECVRDDMGGYCKRLTIHVMECSKCGHTYEHVNGSYEYCPRCGRKVNE